MTGGSAGRPATSLPLGFLALLVATLSFAVLQLEWVTPDDGRALAIGALALTVPLQLVASVEGFAAGDPVVGTGMGLLAGTWASVGVVTVTSRAGSTSDGLGVVLLGGACALLVPATASAVGPSAKRVATLVIGLSAVRFAVTGVAQLAGTPAWLHAAGWVGLALAALSLYAALAFALEASAGRVVLPTGRSGTQDA